jgi:hypothetical protein
MSVRPNHFALFIDGANLHATARTLGFDIDYKRLLKEFEGHGTLLRAFYYTAVLEDQEYSSLRPLTDWLSYNGYTVVTKPVKEFIDAGGRRKVKGRRRACGRRHGACRSSRPDGSVLGRRLFPSPGRGRPASRRPRDGGFDHSEPATDDRRRIAASGRRLYRSHGVAIQAQP